MRLAAVAAARGWASLALWLAGPVVAGSVVAGPVVGGDTTTVSERHLRAHMEFLASDALGGRGSGTRDELLAATYVAAQLRQFGVEPTGDAGGYVQAVEVLQRSLASRPVLSLGPGTDRPPLQWSQPTEVAVTLMTGERLEGPLRKLDAASASAVRPGEVVLLPAAAGSERDLVARLLDQGAVAVILPAGRPLDPAGRASRLSSRPQAPGTPLPPAAVVLLGPGPAEALAAAPEGTTVRLEASLGPPERTLTWNVLGRLPGRAGREAGQVVMLSAHIDHLGTKPEGEGDRIFNGADDDASGVVAVLELARVLAAGPPLRRTVLFALYGSEETGGLGSRYFLERPPVPLASIVADLQFEMIGRPDPAVARHQLWLTGFERSDLGPTLALHGAPLTADPHPEQGFFRRSDNYPLALRGVVAHTVSSFGLHSDYHQASDEISRIDFDHMTRAIAALVEPIRWLADSDFMPRWGPGQKP